MNWQHKTAVALSVLILPLLVIPANANLITYNIWSANQTRVMVMNEDGSGATELFVGGKFLPFAPYSSISTPNALNGETWVAFDNADLFRIQANGDNLTGMLCYFGTDINGEEYDYLYGWQQWSPDGTEILVQTGRYLGLIDADAVIRSDCTSDLEPIFYYDWSGYPVDWHLEGTAAWNDDGSRIAFFEQPPEESPSAPPYNRLTIIARQPDGTWEADDSIYPDPPLPEGFLLFIDWQRSGDLLAFTVRDETSRKAKWFLMWVRLGDGSSGFFQTGGSPLEGRSPSWSPDGSQMIFQNGSDNLVKWTYDPFTFPDGQTETIGPGRDPDWQRNALDLTCSVDADCEDHNPCTNDLCDTNTGQCDHENLADGIPCGESAWCDGSGSCFEPECGVSGLPLCDDGNECTFGECTDWECAFSPAPFGFGCSDGDDCTENDLCDGLGSCAGTPIPGCGACLPSGATCDTNSECCSGSCHPIKGTCK